MYRQEQLISRLYWKSQRKMHANPRGYGKHGDAWAGTVAELARRYAIGSILDYGCGQGRLGVALREQGFHVRDYDPAIEGVSGMPLFADMIVCTDVMEHVEPDKLDNVLGHIRALARKLVFFVIATRPAIKRLPNGKNAHLTIESEEWWQARVLGRGFTLLNLPTVWPAKLPAHCWVGVVKP